jgi:hypothetical protein
LVSLLLLLAILEQKTPQRELASLEEAEVKWVEGASLVAVSIAQLVLAWALVRA